MNVVKRYGFLKFAKAATDKGSLNSLTESIDLGHHSIANVLKPKI